MRKSVADRFWSKVKKTKSCWLWLGTKDDKNYGVFYTKKQQVKAHRFSLVMHGIILDHELVVDHLCFNPPCVRPDHLEQVTLRENTIRGVNPAAINYRKTHCKRGHEFTEENTRKDYMGRHCKMCMKVRYLENRRMKNEISY